MEYMYIGNFNQSLRYLIDFSQNSVLNLMFNLFPYMSQSWKKHVINCDWSKLIKNLYLKDRLILDFRETDFSDMKPK
jgi:hypothetical protein